MVMDLIVIYMPNFDMILAMDVSSKYREIDYRKKNGPISLVNGE